MPIGHIGTLGTYSVPSNRNIVRINTKSQCIIISLQYEKKRPFLSRTVSAAFVFPHLLVEPLPLSLPVQDHVSPGAVAQEGLGHGVEHLEEAGGVDQMDGVEPGWATALFWKYFITLWENKTIE